MRRVKIIKQHTKIKTVRGKLTLNKMLYDMIWVISVYLTYPCNILEYFFISTVQFKSLLVIFPQYFHYIDLNMRNKYFSKYGVL